MSMTLRCLDLQHIHVHTNVDMVMSLVYSVLLWRGYACTLLRLESMDMQLPALEGQRPLTAGRLGLFLQNWSRLTRDKWVLDTVQGYEIDLMAEPFQAVRPCLPTFNQQQMECLYQEIETLVEKGRCPH